MLEVGAGMLRWVWYKIWERISRQDFQESPDEEYKNKIHKAGETHGKYI